LTKHISARKTLSTSPLSMKYQKDPSQKQVCFTTSIQITTAHDNLEIVLKDLDLSTLGLDHRILEAQRIQLPIAEDEASLHCAATTRRFEIFNVDIHCQPRADLSIKTTESRLL
jgi:hypothetical protein